MNSFAFTNPWLLAALLAAGLPVLIHFLTRARPQRVKLPTFRLLQEAAAGQQAVHRLRTWVLLAVRTLAVIALVFWFSRPFLKQADAQVAGSTERVILIIDASLSMRATGAQRVTLFSQAQSAAAAVLHGLPAGSAAAVVMIGTQPRALLPALTKNLEALHDEMIRATATYEAGDPAAALALARRLAGAAGTVHVFSDFQRTNWEGVHLDEYPGLAIRLHSVGRQVFDNAAVTAVKASGDEVSATVFNSTGQPRDMGVRCEIEGMTRETTVRVAPYASRTVEFSVESRPNANVAGKVMLTSSDDLMEDNVRYFSLEARGGQRVLLLSDAEARDFRSSAFYLAAALRTDPRIQLERRLTQEADRKALESADVFVLASPATLTGDTAGIIARRVRDGARLIGWLDGPTAAAMLGALAELPPPFRLARSLTNSAKLAARSGKGPLTVLGEPERTELTALHFQRHYEAEANVGREDDVWLRYEDGAIALMTSPGAAWANLAVGPDGGDLAGHPFFPVLVQEVLRQLNGTRPEKSSPPGRPLLIPISTSGDLRVTGPDDGPIAATRVSAGWQVFEAGRPGIYKVKRGAETLALGVVNPDPRESDLRPLALTEMVTSRSNTVTVSGDAEELESPREERSLWPKFAGLAIGFLALEMIVLAAWPRRGRRS